MQRCIGSIDVDELHADSTENTNDKKGLISWEKGTLRKRECLFVYNGLRSAKAAYFTHNRYAKIAHFYFQNMQRW